ncbi:DUF21 domain-containing protein At2g14520-like [Lytechinus variegatus]|uniref:DUF21 domain-containing protein At2g14520-like n=1 Tax=Lytechinus variegatus TaxID=7654 RepID=UPI001BB16DF8|nr:DUF21 domain-containing protein At2g14520-like [Lytechinus variegatus]
MNSTFSMDTPIPTRLTTLANSTTISMMNSTISTSLTTLANSTASTMINSSISTSPKTLLNSTTISIMNSTISTINSTTNLNTTSSVGLSSSVQYVPLDYHEALDLVNASLLCATSIQRFVEPNDTWFFISIFLYVTLSLMSGLYSALTTSFFSLDLTRLELCIRQGSARERLYAYRVIPLLKSPHMLLVTLNIGSVAAIVCLPILLNFIVRPVFSILLSSFVVFFFNKVLPQAIGERHGLALAGIMTWFVYLSMFLFFIVAWPVAFLLSIFLGTRKERFYQRSELIALMELQMTSPDAAAEKKNLSPDEVLIIKGALDAGRKVAMDAMIPLNEVPPQFPLVNFSHVTARKDQNANTFGDPNTTNFFEDEFEDRGVMSDTDSGGRQPLHAVASNTPLYDILDEMNIGCYRVAAVYDNVTGVVRGILTLQNVLDVILGQSRSSIRRDSRKMTIKKMKLVQSRRQLAIDRRLSLPEDTFKYVKLRLPGESPLIS